jgi:hypothetical protein
VDVRRRTALTRCSRIVELGEIEREGRRPGEERRGEEKRREERRVG